MLRRNIDEIKRISLSPFSIFDTRRDLSSGMAVQFAREVSNMLLPHKRDNIIEINSGDTNIDEKLAIIFSVSQHNDYSTFSAIEEFIRNTAYSLVLNGKVFFEIAEIKLKQPKAESLNSLTLYSLLYIPGEILNCGVGIVQIARNKSKNLIIKFIPRSKSIILKLPNAINNVFQERLINKSLNQSEKIPTQGFEKSKINKFDQLRFYSYQDILAAQSTKSWGWPMGDTLIGKITEYYFVYRYLKFASSLALLREYLLDQINQFLRYINLDCNLKFYKIDSSNDFKRFMDNFQIGELSFDDAIEIIFPKA